MSENFALFLGYILLLYFNPVVVYKKK